MQAARAFAARNPGQPLSVVFFNSQADGRPAADDRPQAGQGGARQGRRSSPRGRASTTRSPRRSRRCAARRSARRASSLLSDGDDVGSVTSLDAALAQLDAQKIRVFTVGIESPDFTADDLQKIADETGGTYAAATSPEALTKIYDELGFQLGNEYLLRYRSTASPTRTSTSRSPSRARSRCRSRTRPRRPGPRRRTSRRCATSSSSRGSSSRSSSFLVLALVVFTHPLALEPPLEQGSSSQRLGDFVTLPAEEHAAERRKEVDALLAAVGQQKKRRRNCRWMEGFAEDVDVAQIKRDPTQDGLGIRPRGSAPGGDRRGR